MMNIQEIVYLCINVAGIGYIYGQIKGQLKNQDALIQTLKDDFNDKFNNFKISVAENSVKVENNQKQLMNALKDDFNEKFNNFKESVAEHFVRVEKKQDIHNHYVERTYNLERQSGIQEEQIKVINHRIEDLEELKK